MSPAATHAPTVLEARAFFEKVLPAMLSDSDGPVLPDGVVVAFHVIGDGGGAWQVVREPGSQLTVGAVRPGPKDCELRCTVDDFMQIVDGRLDARRAFLTGRLRVQGDIGLALRLQQVVLPTRAA